MDFVSIEDDPARTAGIFRFVCVGNAVEAGATDCCLENSPALFGGSVPGSPRILNVISEGIAHMATDVVEHIVECPGAKIGQHQWAVHVDFEGQWLAVLWRHFDEVQGRVLIVERAVLKRRFAGVGFFPDPPPSLVREDLEVDLQFADGAQAIHGGSPRPEMRT